MIKKVQNINCVSVRLASYETINRTITLVQFSSFQILNGSVQLFRTISILQFGLVNMVNRTMPTPNNK